MSIQKYLGFYIGNTIPNTAFNTSGNSFSLTDIPIDYKPMCIKPLKDQLIIQNISACNYFNNFKMFIGQCYSDLDEDTISFYEEIVRNDNDEIKIEWKVGREKRLFTIEKIISSLVLYFYDNSFKKITSPESSKISVVLTYPLYYHLFQKLSLHDIIIDSQIHLSYFIPEPVASIITYIDSEDYIHKKQNDEENIIVLHCGGKTTTVSKYRINKDDEKNYTTLQLIEYNSLTNKKCLIYMIEECVINYLQDELHKDVDSKIRYKIHDDVINYIRIIAIESQLYIEDVISISFSTISNIINKYHQSIVEILPKDDVCYIITTGTCFNSYLNKMFKDMLKSNCINIPILDEKTQKGTESIGASIYGEKYGIYKIIPVLTYDIVLKLKNRFVYLAKKYTVLPFDSNEIIITPDDSYKYCLDICGIGSDKKEVLIDSITIDSQELNRISIRIDEKERIVLHVSSLKDEIVLFPGFDPFT